MSERAPFEVVLAHLDGYARVKLRGEFDYHATVENAEALRALTELRDRVILDLTELDFMDSSGLRFLIALALHHDGPAHVEGASRPVRRVIELRALDHLLDITVDP